MTHTTHRTLPQQITVKVPSLAWEPCELHVSYPPLASRRYRAGRYGAGYELTFRLTEALGYLGWTEMGNWTEWDVSSSERAAIRTARERLIEALGMTDEDVEAMERSASDLGWVKARNFDPAILETDAQKLARGARLHVNRAAADPTRWFTLDGQPIPLDVADDVITSGRVLLVWRHDNGIEEHLGVEHIGDPQLIDARTAALRLHEYESHAVVLATTYVSARASTACAYCEQPLVLPRREAGDAVMLVDGGDALQVHQFCSEDHAAAWADEAHVNIIRLVDVQAVERTQLLRARAAAAVRDLRRAANLNKATGRWAMADHLRAKARHAAHFAPKRLSRAALLRAADDAAAHAYPAKATSLALLAGIPLDVLASIGVSDVARY